MELPHVQFLVLDQVFFWITVETAVLPVELSTLTAEMCIAFNNSVTRGETVVAKSLDTFANIVLGRSIISPTMPTQIAEDIALCLSKTHGHANLCCTILRLDCVTTLEQISEVTSTRAVRQLLRSLPLQLPSPVPPITTITMTTTIAIVAVITIRVLLKVVW